MDINDIVSKLRGSIAPVRAELADLIEKYVDGEQIQSSDHVREIAEDVTPANQSTKKELTTEIQFPPMHVRGRAVNKMFAKGGGGFREKPAHQSASVNKLYNTGLAQRDRQGKDGRAFISIKKPYTIGPYENGKPRYVIRKDKSQWKVFENTTVESPPDHGKLVKTFGYLPDAKVWCRANPGAQDEDIDEELGIDIDTSHDVDVMSELSRDGKTFYVDQSLPKEIPNNGKKLRIIDPLLKHEIEEFKAMRKAIGDTDPTDDERKKIYLRCHKIATAKEKHWIEDNGFDWNGWEAWCRGELSRLEQRKVKNPPPDPDVKPMKHDRRELESNVSGDCVQDIAMDEVIVFDRA